MRDRFVVGLIINFVVLCVICTNAVAYYVDSVVGVEPMSLVEDLTVTNKGNFNVTVTNINDSIAILNRGVIKSNFNVADSLRVYVQNSGVIDGQFKLEPNARLIQIIESADDITAINVNSKFSILVRDAENISLHDVLAIANNANKIILNNSTLVLNGVNRVRANIDAREIEIVGDVVLKLNSPDELNYSVPVLQNVSGAGRVRFDVAGVNPLYKVVGTVDDGKLYMGLARETDYARVLKNDVGNFLDKLRRRVPDDKLLAALDIAPDMDSLNYVMSRSVRLNPIKLMEPVQRMNMFDMLGGWRYADASGIYSYADVMFSDADIGGRASVAIVDNISNNLYAAVTGYIGAIDVSDDINDFGAYVYGVNIAARYDDGAMIGDLSIGGNYASFDVGPVFDGASVVNDPSGVSGYMAMNVGMYVLRNDALTIAPFVGWVLNYASVPGDSDTSVLANLATEINWSQHEFDILYDYGARGGVLTDGAFYANTYVKFTAPFDDIGAELDFGFIHDDNGINYKISISAHILF